LPRRACSGRRPRRRRLRSCLLRHRSRVSGSAFLSADLDVTLRCEMIRSAFPVVILISGKAARHPSTPVKGGTLCPLSANRLRHPNDRHGRRPAPRRCQCLCPLCAHPGRSADPGGISQADMLARVFDDADGWISDGRLTGWASRVLRARSAVRIDMETTCGRHIQTKVRSPKAPRSRVASLTRVNVSARPIGRL
jgi:hypothetical protein